MSLIDEKLLSRNSLIFILVALIALRFAVLPLLDWQQSRISEIQSKQVQLGKTIDLVNSYSDYQELALKLKAEKAKLAPLFYVDDDGARLLIQKDIEQIFSDHDVPIERFNWVLDQREDSGLRKLRVLVGFNGQLLAVMRVLLDISKHGKVARQVEWRQNLSNKRETGVGQSRGHVTLEFFAFDSLQEALEPLQDVSGGAASGT